MEDESDERSIEKNLEHKMCVCVNGRHKRTIIIRVYQINQPNLMLFWMRRCHTWMLKYIRPKKNNTFWYNKKFCKAKIMQTMLTTNHVVCGESIVCCIYIPVRFLIQWSFAIGRCDNLIIQFIRMDDLITFFYYRCTCLGSS